MDNEGLLPSIGWSLFLRPHFSPHYVSVYLLELALISLDIFNLFKYKSTF